MACGFPVRPREPWLNNPGVWNAYVEAGETREEQVRRLHEAPSALRAGIKAHVRLVRKLSGGPGSESDGEA